ncbi:nucleoside phosphorylase [Flavobacteriaceae bacterium 14752]|uniref:nucleoside phosphorylase n=1 Tax=Mesohalobacter salilacus TaxID=2491711 RepID=UPI000F633D68|nr:phosphorylase [Flavobacteriaceae bacterium 14752]
MKKIKESELILNSDGSVYHLNLKPEDIADTIITVGDQDRVEKVSQYFDSVLFETQKREFKTHTGFYKGKKLTVISTGIGIDNIDIVMNELDALVNIDLKTRQVRDKLKSLDIIRIGTSGGIQDFVELDKFVMGKAGLGFDGLIYYYENEITHSKATKRLIEHLKLSDLKPQPYIVECSDKLSELFEHEIQVTSGITATNIGFYGPQGRTLRLKLQDEGFLDRLTSFEYNDFKVTNLEMETSAIYALAKMLGHHALSMNAIVANRSTGEFSKNPKAVIDNLIQFTLDRLCKL